MRDVIGHLIKILERGGEAIVCQVVETRGSTPQKAGSIMIVDPDGGQGGTLGGGCVENEVKTKALRQLVERNCGRSLVRAGPRLRMGRRADLRRAMVVVASRCAEQSRSGYFRSIDRFLADGSRVHRGGRHRYRGGRGRRWDVVFCLTAKASLAPACPREEFPTV